MNWQIIPQYLTDNAPLITSISGVIVACCSLFFTMFQSSQVRKHNRLSVLPHITTFAEMAPKKKEYEVQLLNNGLGPARIKKFKYFFRETEIENKQGLEDQLRKLFPNTTSEVLTCDLAIDYMMPAKEKIVLMKIKFLDGDIPSEEEIDKRLNMFSLSIEYSSIYGQKFKFADTK